MLTNPLKVHLLGDRTISVDEQPQQQIGDDNTWLELYPEITPTLDDSSICTDDNAIFVDGVGGSDSDAGDSSNPVFTIATAVTKAVAAGYTQICAIDSSCIFVEGTNIPAYMSFYYQGAITVSFRRIWRTIPTMNDTNTKWVDPVAGSDTGSPTPGTEANPLKTLQAAFDAITTSAFEYVAVLVDEDGTTTMTENPAFIQDITTVTQTVTIVPYILDGSVKKAGASLTLNYDTSPTNYYDASIFATSSAKDYLISSNFDSNNEKTLYVLNYGVSTNAIQYTKDLVNVSGINTSTTQNWRFLGEYQYNGVWYLMAFASVSSTEIKVFYATGTSFSTTGEYSLTVTNYLQFARIGCDGSNIILPANNGYIHYLPEGGSPTSSSDWVTDKAVDTNGNTIDNIFEVSTGEFLLIPNVATASDSYIYKYINGEISSYYFKVNICYAFYLNGVYYGISTKFGDSIAIYVLNFEDESTIKIIENEELSSVVSTSWVKQYKDLIYFYSNSNKKIAIFDGININTVEISYDGLRTASKNLQSLFCGLLGNVFTTSTTSIYFTTIAQISSIPALNAEGVVFSSDNYGPALAGNEVGAQYCRFSGTHSGIDTANDSPLNKYNIFENDFGSIYGEACTTTAGVPQYNLYLGRYDSDTLERSFFQVAHTNESNTSLGVDYCTFYQGLVGIDGNGDMENSVFGQVSQINQNNDTEATIDRCVMPYNFRANNYTLGTYYDGNIYFRDTSGAYPDLRLQANNILASNDEPYQFDSIGVGLRSDTEAGDGYTAANGLDVGCYKLTRNEYSRDWTYQFECDFEADIPVNKTNQLSMFTAVNGKTYIHKTEGGRNIVVWWQPESLTEFVQYKEILDNIMAVNGPYYLYLNSWLNQTSAEISTYAAQNDLGIESGPTTSNNATFTKSTLALTQSYTSWVPNRYNGFLLYLKYTVSGTEYETYLRIIRNTETTIYCENTENFSLAEISTSVDNTTNSLVFVIGAIRVDCQAEEISTQISNIMASGSAMPANVTMAFQEV